MSGTAAARTFVVTGANSGIGFETARALVSRGARAPSSAWVAMLVSVLFALHAGPFAAVGLAALAFAIWSAMTQEGWPNRERKPD